MCQVSGNGHATHEDAFWDVGTLVTWEPDPSAHWVSDSDCWKGACNHLEPITKVQTGPNITGWFKSEFGCVTWSSYESVSPMLHDANYGPSTSDSTIAPLLSKMACKQNLECWGQNTSRIQNKEV